VLGINYLTSLFSTSSGKKGKQQILPVSLSRWVVVVAYFLYPLGRDFFVSFVGGDCRKMATPARPNNRRQRKSPSVCPARLKFKIHSFFSSSTSSTKSVVLLLQYFSSALFFKIFYSGEELDQDCWVIAIHPGPHSFRATNFEMSQRHLSSFQFLKVSNLVFLMNRA
jgi:hypothetical protein